jgi:hypothetical protein
VKKAFRRLVRNKLFTRKSIGFHKVKRKKRVKNPTCLSPKGRYATPSPLPSYNEASLRIKSEVP